MGEYVQSICSVEQQLGVGTLEYREKVCADRGYALWYKWTSNMRKTNKIWRSGGSHNFRPHSFESKTFRFMFSNWKGNVGSRCWRPGHFTSHDFDSPVYRLQVIGSS